MCSFLHFLQSKKDTLHILGSAGILATLIAMLVMGLYYYSELYEYKELGSSVYERIKLPLRDIYLKKEGQRCSTYFEKAVLYEYPGTQSKCSCKEFGVSKGLCSQDSSCQSQMELKGGSFAVWQGHEFCVRSYSSKDILVDVQVGCEKQCGRFCMKDGFPCPINGVSFIENSKRPSENDTIDTVKFNDSHTLVITRYDGSSDDAFVNKIEIGFNGAPCFMGNLQNKWLGEDMFYQKQNYGCDETKRGVNGSISDSSEAFDSQDGLSFYKENMKDSEIEQLISYYDSPLLDEFQAQEVLLFSSNRVEMEDTFDCWNLEFDDLQILSGGIEPNENSYLVIWELLILTLYFFLFSIVFSGLVMKTMKPSFALIARVIFLLVGLLDVAIVFWFVWDVYHDSSLSTKGILVLEEVLKYNCFQDDILNSIIRFLMNGLEITSTARSPLYLLAGVSLLFSIWLVVLGFIGSLLSCCSFKSEQKSEILLTKMVL